MFDWVAFSLDLHSPDHVKQRVSRIRFGFKLPSIRRLLPNLSETHVKRGCEHVKLRRDHVKLRLKLPCTGAIELCTVAGITGPSAIAPRQSRSRFRCDEI